MLSCFIFIKRPVVSEKLFLWRGFFGQILYMPGMLAIIGDGHAIIFHSHARPIADECLIDDSSASPRQRHHGIPERQQLLNIHEHELLPSLIGYDVARDRTTTNCLKYSSDVASVVTNLASRSAK